MKVMVCADRKIQKICGCRSAPHRPEACEAKAVKDGAGHSCGLAQLAVSAS